MVSLDLETRQTPTEESHTGSYKVIVRQEAVYTAQLTQKEKEELTKKYSHTDYSGKVIAKISATIIRTDPNIGDLETTIIIDENSACYRPKKNPWDYGFSEAVHDAQSKASKAHLQLTTPKGEALLSTKRMPRIIIAMNELELKANELYEEREKQRKTMVPEKGYFPTPVLQPIW